MKKVLFSLLLAFVCLPVAIAQTKDAPVFHRIDKTVCGSFTWNITGETYTADTAVMRIQGDTAYALFLTMAEPTYDTVDTVFLSGPCSVTFRDSVFTVAGTFDAVMPTASGCDSVVRLDITLAGIDSTNQTLTVCDSMMAPWGEMLYASLNTVKDTTVDGCARHDVLNLTVNHAYHGDTLEVTAECSYTWNGQTITDTLVHNKVFTTVGGCDSTQSVRVTNFSHLIEVYDTIAACDSYNTWDTTFTTSGNYVNSVVNSANNCTTTTYLNLTINPVYTDTADVTVRDVNAGCYYTFNGQNYTDTNVVHYGMLTSAAGCDSLAAIRIISHDTNQFDTVYLEYCGYRYPWGNSEHYGWTRYIVNPSDPNHTSLDVSDDIVSDDTTYYLASARCTFHRHIDIKFVHMYDDTIRRTGCEKVEYSFTARNGGLTNDVATFTENGVYTTDTNGVELYSRHFQTYCVTHHTISVNIMPVEQRPSDTIVINTCDRYTFKMNARDADSITFTADTLYTRIRNYRSLTQCYDTIIPLDVTIRKSSFIDNNVIVCDSYLWPVDSNTYTHNIIINDTLRDTTNAVGCDSIGRLHLTVQKSPEVSIEGNWILEPGQTAVLNAVCTMPGVTYDWYKNDVLVSNNHTATLTVEPNGNENVDIRLSTTKVYSQITCVTNNWITVTTNVGIDDVDAMVVNIYPNPTSRILNLQSAEGLQEVTVYNMIGQQVLTQKGNGERMQLDLGDLANGSYTLSITSANGNQTTRKINVTK